MNVARWFSTADASFTCCKAAACHDRQQNITCYKQLRHASKHMDSNPFCATIRKLDDQLHARATGAIWHLDLG